jgi:excisionase family DNA binding protein
MGCRWEQKMRTELGEPTPLMSVKEAAAYLDIASGTLRNWLSAKRITMVKVGRLTKIQRTVLDQCILSNLVNACEDI